MKDKKLYWKVTLISIILFIVILSIYYLITQGILPIGTASVIGTTGGGGGSVI